MGSDLTPGGLARVVFLYLVLCIFMVIMRYKILLYYVLSVFWIKMTSLEQFLDDYEISRLMMIARTTGTAVMILDWVVQKMKKMLQRKILMMILTLCTMLLTLVTMDSRKTDVEHLETGENTHNETNGFQGKDFTWSRIPPKVARARWKNIIVCLLLSVIRFDDKATRTGRRLEDKMAAFREIWDKFIGLC